MDTTNIDNQPKWLRRLHKESWQAELIISGLAIFGALRLPVAFNHLVDFLIAKLTPELYYLGFCISICFSLAISLLTVILFLHFVLRAYWVGLIGLNSVYPAGYQKEGNYYSPFYMEKMIEYIPSIRSSIKKLDNVCSTLFAGACGFAMMYCSVAIMLTLLLIITNLLIPRVGVEIAFIPIFIWGAAIAVQGIIGALAVSKKLKQNQSFQHFYFKLSKATSYLLFPGIFKSISQLMLTFYSNFKYDLNFFRVGIVMVVAGLYMTSFEDKSNLLVLSRGEDYFENLKSDDYHRNNFYLDKVSHDSKVVNPIIPSEIISGSIMKLFIPVFTSEQKMQDDLCGEYVKDEALDRSENKLKRWAFQSSCCQRYIKVTINGQAYDLDMPLHQLNHKSERGVMTHIPTTYFIKGKNEIRVTKIKNAQGESFREYRIPFWYEG